MLKKCFLIVLALLFGFQLASAHDAWLEPNAGGLALFYGHGSKHDPYDPAKVKEVKAVDCKGKSIPIAIEKKGDFVSLTWKDRPGIVTLVFDGGYGCKTTDGWKRTTKREAQGKFEIVKSYRIRKFAKALQAQCDSYASPVGLAFEIVPKENPLSVKPGQSLPVEVLLEGKPVEEAVFKITDAKDPEKKTEIKTDKNGNASIPILKAGPQRVVAKLKLPLKDDPDADTLSLSTSLTFRAN